MRISQGYPFNIQSRSAYLEAVKLLGFVKAHKIFLQDLKSFYAKDPFLRRFPHEAAEQAYHLHVYFVYLAMHTLVTMPTIHELDGMFVEVFGRMGKDVLEIAGVAHRVENSPGLVSANQAA